MRRPRKIMVSISRFHIKNKAWKENSYKIYLKKNEICESSVVASESVDNLLLLSLSPPACYVCCETTFQIQPIGRLRVCIVPLPPFWVTPRMVCQKQKKINNFCVWSGAHTEANSGKNNQLFQG